MDFKNLNDSLYMLPAKPGTYQWWSRALSYIPAFWDGKQWFINGIAVSCKTVRYWR